MPSAPWLDLIYAVDAYPGYPVGRFKLLAWLSGGGMGVVFRAHDTELDREVALKLWKLPQDEARAAVIHEAKCLARLSHPNVVVVHGTDEIDGDLVLVMELIDGMDGRTWISTQRPSWTQIVDFYLRAGRGLAAAHAAGLEHGDFKPENVLIGRDRRVRVADFGVARALREHITSGDSPHNAEESAGLGTPAYMAPERLLGSRGDARSDQFSFCVTLWECLYGKRPFGGRTEAAILEAMERGVLQMDPAETAPEIPRRLRQVIMRGLAIDPAERWLDMNCLLAALLEIRERPDERKRWREIAAAGLGLVVGSSTITAWLVMSHTGSPAETGISPLPATTSGQATGEEAGDTGPENDLAAALKDLIEAGELDTASQKWTAATREARARGTSIELELLEVARALYTYSLTVEHANPTRASEAAFHGFAILAYLSTHELDGVSEEIQNMRDTWERMTSTATLLVTQYSELSLGQLEQVCTCARGHADDRCKPQDAAVVHECLASLLANDQTAVIQYLDCVVPALTKHGECLGAVTNCDPEGLGACEAERAQAMGACPPLAPTLETAFAGCTLGD